MHVIAITIALGVAIGFAFGVNTARVFVGACLAIFAGFWLLVLGLTVRDLRDPGANLSTPVVRCTIKNCR